MWQKICLSFIAYFPEPCMKTVFTYGSLMFAPVWQRIVTGHYASASAALEGYQRRAVKEEEYPAIFPANKSHQVSGILYFAVSDCDLIRLDAFEGEYYQRTTVNVQMKNTTVVAQAYVLHPAFYSILSNQEWSAEAFAREGMNEFIEKYKGFA